MLFHTPFSHDFLLPLLFGTPLLVLGLIPKALVILEWRNLQMMTTGQCYTGTAFQQMFYTGNFISNPWKHSVAGLISVLILKWRNLGFKRLRTWPYLCNWIWKCWISNWDPVTTKYLLFLLSGPSSVKTSVTLSSPPLFSPPKPPLNWLLLCVLIIFCNATCSYHLPCHLGKWARRWLLLTVLYLMPNAKSKHKIGICWRKKWIDGTEIQNIVSSVNKIKSMRMTTW